MATDVAWHVSPTANRDSIAEHGLNPTLCINRGYVYTGDAAGTYMFTTRAAAMRAALHDFIAADIYEIDTNGLDIETDPNMGDACRTTEPICSTRVTLLGHTAESPSTPSGRRFVEHHTEADL